MRSCKTRDVGWRAHGHSTRSDTPISILHPFCFHLTSLHNTSCTKFQWPNSLPLSLTGRLWSSILRLTSSVLLIHSGSTHPHATRYMFDWSGPMGPRCHFLIPPDVWRSIAALVDLTLCWLPRLTNRASCQILARHDSIGTNQHNRDSRAGVRQRFNKELLVEGDVVRNSSVISRAACLFILSLAHCVARKCRVVSINWGRSQETTAAVGRTMSCPEVDSMSRAALLFCNP